MDEWLQRQAPLDRALANSLIEATPDTWNQALVEVQRWDEDGREHMTVVISSPDGRHEIITPTDDIYAALYSLSDLLRERGSVWRSLTCTVALDDSGDWTYRVEYGY